MNTPEAQPEQQQTSSADGHPESALKKTARCLKSILACHLPVLHIPVGVLALIVMIELVIDPFYADKDNSWSIWLISYLHNRAVNTPAYTFVDVDDRTFSKWSPRGYTDRARIVGLIEKMPELTPKPRAIVVDIDLSGFHRTKG